MGEFKGYYPDGLDGTVVCVETGEILMPDAIELQERASKIFGEPIKFPLDPAKYRKETPDV